MRFEKKDIFTIPNILTYIRLICLPFFLWMMFGSLTKSGTAKAEYILVGLIIFIFASITDILDGKIARKYNMVSDIGKVLDPVADKLLQCFAILTIGIVSNIWFIWIFMSVLIAKEIFMGVSSKYFMRASKRQIEQMANKIGKLGAVINFVGIILAFLLNTVVLLKNISTNDVEMLNRVVNTIKDVIYWITCVEVLFACCWQIFAAYNYTKIYYSRLVELRKSGVLDTLDRYGNPLEDNKD